MICIENLNIFLKKLFMPSVFFLFINRNHIFFSIYMRCYKPTIFF